MSSPGSSTERGTSSPALMAWGLTGQRGHGTPAVRGMSPRSLLHAFIFQTSSMVRRSKGRWCEQGAAGTLV